MKSDLSVTEHFTFHECDTIGKKNEITLKSNSEYFPTMNLVTASAKRKQYMLCNKIYRSCENNSNNVSRCQLNIATYIYVCLESTNYISDTTK